MKTHIHFWNLAILFLEWEIVQTKVAEKIKTQFYVQNIFPPENRAVYEKM
jgi:hypothetical protein